MNSKIILFVLISLTLTGFTTLNWQEFKSNEGKFIVKVPGEMTEKTRTMKTDMGDLNFHQFIFKPQEKNPDNVFYLVSYCDYPKGTFPKDSTELINDFFNETIETSVKSVAGKLAYQSDIQLVTYLGKIWRVTYNKENATIKSKCFLVNDRFYMLQTMMTKTKSMNLAADKFLDSFQIF